MMSEALKPCPFCGHDASVYRTYNGKGGYFAGCSSASDTCICGAGVIRDTKEHAVTAWNRRVNDKG